jgi:hypothetical protein
VKTPIVFAAGLLVAGALLVPLPARAQGTYRSQPIGGRSALRGNTGVVWSDDAGGVFVNTAAYSPVGLTGSASMNLFRLTYETYGDWYAPGVIDQTAYPGLTLQDEGLSRTSFRAVPASICLSTSLGTKLQGTDRKPVLGACYATVDNAHAGTVANQRKASLGNWTEDRAQTITSKFDRFFAGPVLVWPLSDTVTLGVSAYAVIATMEQIASLSSLLTDGSNYVVPSFERMRGGASYGLGATAGVTWRAERGVGLGIGLSTPSAHLFGNYAGSSARSYNVAGQTYSELVREKGMYRSSLPPRINAGVA